MPSKYWKYENIKSVHLELSTLCNSICPWCPRYEDFSPNLNPNIVEGAYSLERFKDTFPMEFIQQIQMWTFAGDYGDPCTAPDIVHIIDYINKATMHSPTIQINTNGGMKNEKFWYDLGMSMNSNSYVIFSVDGLHDTNHIYRRNVKWPKVMNAMETYSSTGATGIWEYLKFKHNEHQIEKARELADSFGFEIRFKNPNGFEGKPMPAKDKDYNILYEIYPANNRTIEPISQRTRDFINIIDTLDYSEYKDNIENFNQHSTACIRCSANHDFGGGYEVRINHDGTVWPCSYFGHLSRKKLDGRYVSRIQQWQMKDTFKDINNDLNKLTLKEILDSDPFANVYNKWDGNKMMLCHDVCGNNKVMENIYA